MPLQQHLKARLSVDKITHQVTNQERGTLIRCLGVVGDRRVRT